MGGPRELADSDVSFFIRKLSVDDKGEEGAVCRMGDAVELVLQEFVAHGAEGEGLAPMVAQLVDVEVCMCVREPMSMFVKGVEVCVRERCRGLGSSRCTHAHRRDLLCSPPCDVCTPPCDVCRPTSCTLCCRHPLSPSPGTRASPLPSTGSRSPTSCSVLLALKEHPLAAAVEAEERHPPAQLRARYSRASRRAQ